MTKRVHLLAGPAEDRAVAAFQPHDRLACCGVFAQPPIDLLLGDLSLVMTLADTFDPGPGWDQIEDVRREQIVVQYDVRLTENAQRLQRQQLRIARPRSDEINHALAGPILVAEAVRARRGQL